MSQVPRLLKSIKPSYYELHFDIDLAGHRFKVDQAIAFALARKSKTLTLHAVGLKIHNGWVDGSTKAKSIKLDAAAQTVRFEFAQELSAGQHVLEVTASGDIQESLHGLYRSKYEYQGATKWLAVTQFEAVHAREAFICIDEPAAKAVFEVSITTHEALTVLSNTQNIRELSLESGRVRHDFAPTPVMSTYLVAFVVGEFEHIQRTTASGVVLRLYGTPGRKRELAFALETSERALTFIADYFDIPYPLPKLDMVAIPDFASGAMENWGLVTYRETELLLDPDHASHGNRQRIVTVIAHELAHQWFGNLVTMAWWNDLWLNEGFATWMEVFVQDHLFPEWDVWTQFTADHYTLGLELDGLANTHPVDVPVGDPRELDEIFDDVSYSKGGAIINMLHGYIGDEAFRRGLQLYFKQYAYANTTTVDLWKSLAKTSKLPIVELISAWTSQPGYPLLTSDGEQYHQARFFASPREAAKNHPPQTWPIPLNGLDPDYKISPTKLVATDAFNAPADVTVKLNGGQTGFYRVLYHEADLDSLSEALTSGELPARDRFGVVSDVFATTRAGLTPSSTALKLTSLLRDEINYVVWSALAQGFGSILNSASDEPVRNALKGYGRWLVAPNVQRLGWDAISGESYFDGLMRPYLLQQAIRYDSPTLLNEARQIFDSRKAIDPNIKSAIYAGLARSGDEADFDQLYAIYRHEQNPHERMRVLKALCQFRQPELIARALDLALSSDVRPQDSIFVLAWCLLNHDGSELTWRYIKKNWEKLVKLFGGGGMILEHIPHYLGNAFATQTKADEVREFFARVNQPGLVRPVAQALEAIELRADLYARDKVAIQTYLSDHAH